MRREEIEQIDFPAARRGYDRAAVDAHLAEVAGKMQRLEQDAANPDSSLANTAGARVASVIAAAEEKAAEIEEDARREAALTRSTAQGEARAMVANAEESVSGLISEAEELRNRVRSLADGLAPSAGVSAETEPAIVPEPTPPEREIDPTPVIVPEPSPEPVPEPSPDPVPEPMPEPTPLPQPSTPQAPAAGANANDAGARLVGMKMALDGASRGDVEKHLRSSFDVSSPGELLDEVFARAER